MSNEESNSVFLFFFWPHIKLLSLDDFRPLDFHRTVTR
jgi:hypothetical protein